MSLEQALKKHKISIAPEFDKGLLREGNQWFVAKTVVVDGHEIKLAWFGDWGRDIKEHWSGGLNGSAESPEVKKQIAEMKAAETKEKEKVWDEQAKNCEAEFGTFSERGHSPYMARKQITELFGARLESNPHGDPIVVVPLRDVDGKLWNLQRIYSKRFKHGDKFFTAGAKVDGCFHTLTPVAQTNLPAEASLETRTPNEIYICEGFATAASVALALRGHASNPPVVRLVVSAINAGNLLSVGVALRGKFKDARIIFCADNDAYTVIDGRSYNVGIEKARKAAGACKGEVVFPTFKYPAKGLTDLNDLFCAQGVDAVLDQLLNPGKYVKDLQPVIQETVDGKKQRMGEIKVAEHVLKWYGDKLVKFGENLFKYNGTHWEEFEERDYDRIKLQISFSGNNLPSKETAAVYRSLLYRVPHVPPGVNLYEANPYRANFLNGTLHLSVNGGLSLEPHAREDWCMSVLPHECPDLSLDTPPTPMFDQWCERLWPAPEIRAEVVKLVLELMGSCLTPCYPNITFFIGKSNSGKSTLVKLMVSLVSLKNTCQVQLCDMKGFALEAMIGKLVNFDTELELNKPINDVVVKKIVDRAPFNIDRKFKKQVSGFLPAVHFFAANGLPPTLDGQSQAYGRRIIVVRTDAPLAKGEETLNFEKVLLEKEGKALLARAIREGLAPLHQRNGVFTKPQGSAELVEEMETDSDVVKQFLDDSREGAKSGHAFVVEFGEDFQAIPDKLWAVFAEWQETRVATAQRIGRNAFYQRMKLRGFSVRGVNGFRTFRGIAVKGDAV